MDILHGLVRQWFEQFKPALFELLGVRYVACPDRPTVRGYYFDLRHPDGRLC